MEHAPAPTAPLADATARRLTPRYLVAAVVGTLWAGALLLLAPGFLLAVAVDGLGGELGLSGSALPDDALLHAGIACVVVAIVLVGSGLVARRIAHARGSDPRPLVLVVVGVLAAVLHELSGLH